MASEILLMNPKKRTKKRKVATPAKKSAKRRVFRSNPVKVKKARRFKRNPDSRESSPIISGLVGAGGAVVIAMLAKVANKNNMIPAQYMPVAKGGAAVIIGLIANKMVKDRKTKALINNAVAGAIAVSMFDMARNLPVVSGLLADDMSNLSAALPYPETFPAIEQYAGAYDEGGEMGAYEETGAYEY